MTAALGLATDPSDWVSPGNSTVSSDGDPRDLRERGEAWWRRQDTLGDVDRDDTSPPDRATSLRVVDQTARRRLLFLEEEVTFLADRVAHLESHRPAESPVTLVAFTSANVASRRADANPSTAAKTAANPSSIEDVQKSGSAASTPSARSRAASMDDHISLTISDVSNISACSSFDSAAFPFSASPSRASAETPRHSPVTPRPAADDERLTLDARANDFDFDPLRVHRARGRRLLHPSPIETKSPNGGDVDSPVYSDGGSSFVTAFECIAAAAEDPAWTDRVRRFRECQEELREVKLELARLRNHEAFFGA